MTRPIHEPDSQPGIYRQVAHVRRRVSSLERRPSTASAANPGAWFAYRNSAAITLTSGTPIDSKDHVDTLIDSDLTAVGGSVELDTGSPLGSIRLSNTDPVAWAFGMSYRFDPDTWNDSADMYVQSYLYTAGFVFDSGAHSVIPAAALTALDVFAADYHGHTHVVPQREWFYEGIWGEITQRSGGTVEIPAGSDSDPGLVIWGIKVN